MKSKSIVIADDDNNLTDVLYEVFEEHDYEVYKAYDGDDALAIYRKYHPKLALVDIDMPGKTGLELTDIIRATDNHTLIVVLTGFLTGEEDSLDCYQKGVNLFLRKPMPYREIFACVDSLMKSVYRPLNEIVKFGNFTLDVTAFKLISDITEHKLTERETKTLQLFHKYKNQTVSLNELTGYLFQSTVCDSNTQMIRNTITDLKKKIASDSSVSIDSVYGKGYILRTNGNTEAEK